MSNTIIGYGSIVKLGSTAQGEVRTLTPPPQTYERIAIDHLGSTLRSELQGIEDTSDFSFDQLWQPGDSNHALVDVDFSDRTESSWSIVYPGVNDGSGGALTATQTWTFNARVMSIEPAALENSSVVSRTVTLNRTGAITTS